MDPWYKVATPRKEVREGRSFNPDEFAIALEQVVAGTAPEDYCNPAQFFARTCWTRALREHAGMVLRRLAGRTDNTAPVLTLITQFGGGKTHTLTALYHLGTSAPKAAAYAGVSDLLQEAGLGSVPEARVAVFVGNAWDPQEGRETPWLDIARQLAGDAGVEALGKAALTTAPGTEAIARVFAAANAPVLLLFDEVLNFLNRHRSMADPFHAFIQNLTVATTGTAHGAAVISLPRSQVEMTDWDMQWQDRITKLVRRVAKDLITNDETEISEVVRRRLFEDLGSERTRKNVAKTFADWCFERRAQLPPEWTAVDTTATEAKAREFLLRRFETCYPFHPATLSVFQRKWQALAQYQQTRGTLAMLAQWIAWAYRDGFGSARREPLIALGSAPLHDPGFCSTILGQLGESRLIAAIDADIAGEHSHARALDADTKGPLRDIHRRVGTAILFESSGGQVDKMAHLPELWFALGEPEVDTTSVDNAAYALEGKSYFVRRVGSDGFKISHQPTMKKVVSDRRASLDEETEIKPATRKLVEAEFKRGATVPLVLFPRESTEIADTPKLTLVVADPDIEWTNGEALRQQIGEWTRQRGTSPRLYPASLVWCVRKPGRDLRDKVETQLAWERVAKEITEGTLGGDFARSDLATIQSQVSDAAQAAKDEVWGGYRFVVIADRKAPVSGAELAGANVGGLKIIDLGAGHSSSGETLCGRVMAALKTEALLNESVGAGYIERNWPRPLKESGAWPLLSLRQSFLDGSLTRLLDADATLRTKIIEFVESGDFGFASGPQPDGAYTRVWFKERIGADEVAFDQGVHLLTKAKAEALKSPVVAAEPGAGATAEPEGGETAPTPGAGPAPPLGPGSGPSGEPGAEVGEGGTAVPTLPPKTATKTIRLVGPVPPELWNRLGTKVIPALRKGNFDLRTEVSFVATVDAGVAGVLASDLRHILADLGLEERLSIEES